MEVLVVDDGDKVVEIIAGELVLDGEVSSAGEGSELGDQGGELDEALDAEDFVFTFDVGDEVVVVAGVEFAAVAAHECDLAGGGRRFVEGGVVVVLHCDDGEIGNHGLDFGVNSKEW